MPTTKDNTQDVARYADNIRAIYQSASPEEIKAGRAWYQDAHDYAAAIAHDFNLPLSTVTAVIAAISPNCSWEINKRVRVTIDNVEIAQ